MTHEYQAPTEEQVAELNAATHYAAYSVFRITGDLPGTPAELSVEVQALTERFAPEGLVVRGFYDVSTLRADADLMVWWHAPRVETLQAAYHALRRTELGRVLAPVWSSVGIHRPAEFNRSHLPAFLTDDSPGAYVCVYPFVRSYEWYLLPDAERRTMLRDHGMAAAGFKDIKAHTISAFALGDYEWLLAFEAEELARIVDLMRELRATKARRHVREEIPFYTGTRRDLGEFLAEYR